MARIRGICWLNLLMVGLVACVLRPAGSGPLIYEGPYRVDLAVGQGLPGTDVRYLGLGPRGAQVRIGGQEVTRLSGDSLDAETQPHPTLKVRYNLRVYAYDKQALHALGTIRVELQEAQPRPASLPKTAAVRFTAPVTYRVPKGGVIPGTSIIFAGREEGRARLEGVPGYPYRDVGDSILWEGQVHPLVYLAATFRVLLVEDEWLTVVGTAEVWLSEF
ncbi:MAG TPA: hypothetical protein VNK89_05955 [Thermoflexus sp.]|nr:hypothetical protein [Thermoflexus sp.]